MILLEVGCGQQAAFQTAHIPGARYLDTGELECLPLFNKVDNAALLVLLLSYGIHHGSTVVLYGRNPLAAARAAHLMLYAGVADVRLLDGGFALWLEAGMPCERGPAHSCAPARGFGAAFPLCPQYMTGIEKARGDIAGARWGRAGREGDVNSMSEYQHPDGRMLSAAAIARMWEGEAIGPGRASVFYCGTGWRASLAFFYAWLMGWDDISVYDGGWFEWSAEPGNPIVLRIADSVAA